MIKSECYYCNRMSEQVTAGGCCPWCGNRNSKWEKIVRKIMPILMSVLVGCALGVLSCDLLAQAGVYYDPARNGEGVTVFDNGETALFYFYGYGDDRCDLVEGVEVSETECATATAVAECPLDKKGEPLCDPVTVEVTQCATATAQGIEKTCDKNGTRWFFASDPFDGLASTGILYTAEGLNWPEGVPNPEIWQGVYVGKVFPVGLYLMEWDGSGWTLTVIAFGDKADPDDGLYKGQFYFTQKLFP